MWSSVSAARSTRRPGQRCSASSLRSCGFGPRHLGLDLSAVDFLDSSGLRALLVVQQAVASGGRQVRVVGSTPMIDRLLEITGLEALFPHDAA